MWLGRFSAANTRRTPSPAGARERQRTVEKILSRLAPDPLQEDELSHSQDDDLEMQDLTGDEEDLPLNQTGAVRQAGNRVAASVPDEAPEEETGDDQQATLDAARLRENHVLTSNRRAWSRGRPHPLNSILAEEGVQDEERESPRRARAGTPQSFRLRGPTEPASLRSQHLEDEAEEDGQVENGEFEEELAESDTSRKAMAGRDRMTTFTIPLPRTGR